MRRCRAQALLCQEGDAGLPGSVVGEDNAAVGGRLRDDSAAPPRAWPGQAKRLRPPRALNPLDMPGSEQALNRCPSIAPAHQASTPSCGSCPATQTTGDVRICWTSGSASATQRSCEKPRPGSPASPRPLLRTLGRLVHVAARHVADDHHVHVIRRRARGARMPCGPRPIDPTATAPRSPNSSPTTNCGPNAGRQLGDQLGQRPGVTALRVGSHQPSPPDPALADQGRSPLVSGPTSRCAVLSGRLSLAASSLRVYSESGCSRSKVSISARCWDRSIGHEPRCFTTHR